VLSGLFVLLLFLALTSTALASTSWYVDGLNGNDSNNCMSPQTACETIGHAIALASSGDSIMVASATYSENLTIGVTLRLIGSGATTTIIDGGHKGSVVTVSSAKAHVTIAKVTIQNGLALAGGGISNQNGGTILISNSTISGNSAYDAKCKRFCLTSGGGVYNLYPGTLTISNSTLTGNSAQYKGGGISNGGALTISNSTLTANSAALGGTIFNGGTLTINNSTLGGNKQGIYNSNTATLQNSIVANNIGGNCSGTVTSNGYNLSSDDTCNFNGPGDLNNTNPLLGPLQNNGGQTQTMALPEGSPALDAGNPNGCTNGNGLLLKTDQRGAPRPGPHDHHGCDIGAYENQMY
jgi:hypothetical protein